MKVLFSCFFVVSEGGHAFSAPSTAISVLTVFVVGL